jgi:3-hydroxybutyryl-CoA dehydrogenase
MSEGQISPSPPVAILGAGLMGHGIAYLFARAGYTVHVHDRSSAMLESLRDRVAGICGLLGSDPNIAARIHPQLELAPAVIGAQLVIEAVAEELQLKRVIFRELVDVAPTDAILASNTSALPIRAISEGLPSLQRIIGAHFWNPPHLVPLVEVVAPDHDSLHAAETLCDMLRGIGQHPVVVLRDIPGLIGNRLQHALKREAIALVAAGVCDAETIDDVVKLGFGSRMPVLGPLEQSDLVGLELTRRIHDVLMPVLDTTLHTHPYLEERVSRGELGMATGKGFRPWTPESAQAVRDRLARHLVEVARARLANG